MDMYIYIYKYVCIHTHILYLYRRVREPAGQRKRRGKHCDAGGAGDAVRYLPLPAHMASNLTSVNMNTYPNK